MNAIINLEVILMSEKIKKWLTLGIFGQILVAMIIITIPLDSSADGPPVTVWVDDDYYDDEHDGGHDWDYNAFNSIQTAISRVGIGGTVKVYAGTYSERLTINKPLTLESQDNANDVIIDGNSGGNVIAITSNEVTIKGFTIQNSGHSHSGIFIMGTQVSLIVDCLIRDCIVKNNGNGLYMIYAGQDPNNYIDILNNKIILNSKDGIFLDNSNHNYIHYNEIDDNSNNGIFVYESDNNNILNNQDTIGSISNNGLFGIYIINSDFNLIQDNWVHDNDGDGIRLDDSYLNEIYTNKIYDNNADNDDSNGEDGIFLYNSHGIKIGDNLKTNYIFNEETVNQQKNGITIVQSNSNIIKNNNIKKQKVNGIVIKSCETDNEVTDNTINDNRDHAILIDSSLDVALNNNIMTSCGIMIKGNSRNYWNTHTIAMTNTVNSNQVIYWTEDYDGRILSPSTLSPGTTAGQIILAGCQQVTVKNFNTGTLNGGSVSILMGFTIDCLIQNNKCNNNNKYGICLWKENECTSGIGLTTGIINNECKNNGEVNLLLFNDNCGFVIDGNTIDGNNLFSHYGIKLECNNLGNEIKNNEVVWNLYGIYILSGSTGIQVQDNDIENNDYYGVKIDMMIVNTTVNRNNFINNNGYSFPDPYSPTTIQAYDDGIGNNWDSNYWNDWDPPAGPYAVAGIAINFDNNPASVPW